MSILDALRVQKAGQKSIRDLAMLPQNQIIRLAQLGQIPADVVPVVINEKARMAQEGAQLQAAAQREMPTVIEQAMQVNAQAEQPQMRPQTPPQMPPQMPAQMPQAAPQMPPQAGVTGLPTGEMFQAKNFQTGGIVALSEGGLGEEIDEDDVATAEGLNETVNPAGLAAIAPAKKPASLVEAIQQYQQMFKDARTESPEERAFREARTKGTLSAQDIAEQRNLRLLQAGLGMLGGESPYAFTNIGRGAQEALKGYAEDVRTQKAQKLQDLKEAADLARAKRMEAAEDIKGGAALYEKELDRQQRAELAKESQLGAKYADNYVAMMKAKGDKRPEEIIRDEGYRTFFREYGYAATKTATTAETAAAGQAVTLAVQEQNLRINALRIWEAKSAITDPEKKTYINLLKGNKDKGIEQDPEAAARYLENWLEQAVARSRPRSTAGGGAPEDKTKPARPVAPAAGQAPSSQYRIGETRTVQAGPFKGKTAEWDGTGWKLKE